MGFADGTVISNDAADIEIIRAFSGNACTGGNTCFDPQRVCSAARRASFTLTSVLRAANDVKYPMCYFHAVHDRCYVSDSGICSVSGKDGARWASGRRQILDWTVRVIRVCAKIQKRQMETILSGRLPNGSV